MRATAAARHSPLGKSYRLRAASRGIPTCMDPGPRADGYADQRAGECVTSKVVIDMSMSLDGFVAGPDDGRAQPLGGRGGYHLFDWYFGGDSSYESTMFRPKCKNREVVAEMFRRVGAMLTGRRTYEIANGWSGTHPVNAMPVVVLTYKPPADPPQGRSQLIFVTDGIESAVAKAKQLAQGKDVGIGGASVAQQALRAGLVDELYLHVVPILLGDGVRLFEHLGGAAVHLRKIASLEGEGVSHLRYEVVSLR